jgi:hypothetical protein
LKDIINNVVKKTVPEERHEELCSGGCAQFAVALQRVFGGKIYIAWRKERGSERIFSHCCIEIDGELIDHTGTGADHAWEERFEGCDGESTFAWQPIAKITTLKKHCRAFGVKLQEENIKKWEKAIRKHLPPSKKFSSSNEIPCLN